MRTLSTPMAVPNVTSTAWSRIMLTFRTAARAAFTTNPPLAVAGSLFLLAFAGSLVGVVVDHTVITGMPAWIKPAKFMISSAIYAFTLIWMLGFVRGRGRLVGAASWITVVALVAEDAVIAVQAFRGTASHFNIAASARCRAVRHHGGNDGRVVGRVFPRGGRVAPATRP